MLTLGCSGPGLDARTPASYTSKPPLLNPLSPLPLVPSFQYDWHDFVRWVCLSLDTRNKFVSAGCAHLGDERPLVFLAP